MAIIENNTDIVQSRGVIVKNNTHGPKWKDDK